MEDDKVVAAYRGRMLKKSDLKFLKSPSYITHRLIGTYFYYLHSHTSNKILLVDPTITFKFLNHPEVSYIPTMLDTVKFRDREVVIFPVNNLTENGSIESVSHWSLLVYDRCTDLFHHFDSSSRRENEGFARELYMSTRLFTGPGTNPKYAEVPTPTQTNKYDSGLHVMKMAFVLCEWYTCGRRMHRSYEPCNCITMIINRVFPSLEIEMRNEVQRLVKHSCEDRSATREEDCGNSSADSSFHLSHSENLVHSTMEEYVIVSYKGHELRKSDLEFLKGPCYVTDNLISFYFCLLSERFDAGGIILFVRPSISRWISLCNDPQDILEFVSHLDLGARRFMLFPVNNDMALEGVEYTQPLTHWSLLVYDTLMGYFIHFCVKRDDTTVNGVFAEQIYEKLKSLVPWKPMNPHKQHPPLKLFCVKTSEHAKVFNKYDSGVHVMASAKIICEWYVNLMEWFKPGVSPENERTYLDLIHGMDVSVERDTRSEIKDAIQRITGKSMNQFLL